MIKLRINKKRYKVKTKWAEVSTNDLTPLEFPDVLQAIYKAKPEKQKELIERLTSEQLTKELPDFYRAALVMFSNIPADVLQFVPAEEVTTLYQNTIEGLIYELITLNFNHIQKRVPVKSQFMDEVEIPSYDLTARQFCEAVDLVNAAKDDFRLLKYLPKIYTQKQYDEKEIINSKKQPIERVLDFFFITPLRSALLLIVTRKFLKAVKNQKCQRSELRGFYLSYLNQDLERLNTSAQCECMSSWT